jgi:hypothetical protein
MVDLWERWTEASSTRDSSGQSGVGDDFGLSIIVCHETGGVQCALLFRVLGISSLYSPFLMSSYSEGG